MRWHCWCRFADGSEEITEWITQDGADQMAVETEQANPGCECEIEPVDEAPAA